MKTPLLDSIYTVEPKHQIHAWDNHWNYKWDGRSSGHIRENIRWRKENDNTYILCDTNGVVWRMDKASLDEYLEKLN